MPDTKHMVSRRVALTQADSTVPFVYSSYLAYVLDTVGSHTGQEYGTYAYPATYPHTSVSTAHHADSAGCGSSHPSTAPSPLHFALPVSDSRL